MSDRGAALVTGAARRLGRAIALELARAGYDVAIHYRASRTDAEETARVVGELGRRAVLVCGDFSDTGSPARIVADTVRAFGRLDVLINNASAYASDPDGAFDVDHWARMFQVNATAPAQLIAEAAHHLQRSGNGAVVNLCDISADRPWKRYAAYCASKAALVNLTRSLARRLAPRVRVNGVSPGIAEFPESFDADTRAKLVARVPLGRAGTPDDVAKTVRFLVTDATYMTGQIIPVDGGRNIA